MSDEKKPFQKMGDEMMLQIDHKRLQKEQNYRRAEAFLLWKLGPAYDDARRFLRGSGMDWPSLFVEFVEVVEKDLLARMSYYDKVNSDNLEAKAKFGIFTPVQLTDAEVESLSKDFSGMRVEAGKYDFPDLFKYPPMMESQQPRKPMRRHWKDAPYEYSPEELKKLKEEDDGERQ